MPAPPTRRQLLLAAPLLAACAVAARARPAPAPMKLVYFDDFAPFSRLEAGRMTGIFVDIMDELLLRRLGIPVHHQGYPWARAQQLVRQGEADGFVTVPTPERLAYTVSSQAWVTQGRLAMFVRADDLPLRRRLEKLQSPADLQGLSLGAYLGNGWVKSVLQDRELHFSTSRAQALKMLLARRFDVLIDSANATQAALRATGLSQQVVELPPSLDSNETRLMLGRHSPFTARLPEIDAELRRMRRDGTLGRLGQLPPE